jgi:hypothetical protein
MKSSSVGSEEMTLRTFKEETVAGAKRERHPRVDHRVANLDYLSMQLCLHTLGAY